MKNQVLFVNTNVTISMFRMHESQVTQGRPISQNFFLVQNGDNATLIREEKDHTVILGTGKVNFREVGFLPGSTAIGVIGKSFWHGDRRMVSRIQIGN